MLALNRFKAAAKQVRSFEPADFANAAIGAARKRLRGSVRCIKNAQGFPTLRTGHTQVYWIIVVRSDVDSGTIAEVNFQSASGGAKTTHCGGRGIGYVARGQSAQSIRR